MCSCPTINVSGDIRYPAFVIQHKKECENMKPTCKLIGKDGNVFVLAAQVTKALKKAELLDQAKEFNSTFDNAFGEDIEVKTEVIAPTESRSREVIKYKNVERCSYE